MKWSTLILLQVAAFLAFSGVGPWLFEMTADWVVRKVRASREPLEYGSLEARMKSVALRFPSVRAVSIERSWVQQRLLVSVKFWPWATNRDVVLLALQAIAERLRPQTVGVDVVGA